jgi:predicted 3-demethylubiquinone-9 3-methyltransferase (glyoxalase superfamily)
MKELMQKITPFLWFNNNAEEAVDFYISVFKDSSIGKVARYGDAGPGPKGQLMTAEFKLNGQEFIALNGGPHFTFNEAISFVVDCKDQQEVDYYWDKLSEGGQKSMCGWLKDKFGLSWQVVPSVLPKLLGDAEVRRSQNVMRAMMKMQKIVIRELEQAYEL